MMIQEMLRAPLLPWQKRQGNCQDIVLDSRVRLVRNINGHVFPHRAGEETLEQVIKAGFLCMEKLQAIGHGTYAYTALSEFSPIDRELLVLHHLSTPAHMGQIVGRGLLWRDDGAAVVLLNEEDHFCIQTAARGFELQTVWDEAAQIDDAIENKVNVAFRDDVGYLTASPSMTGTGLIAGVTLHIPAIVAMKRLNRIVQGITKFGFSLGNVYGERNDTLGNVFQITSQITLGVSETDILEQLHQLTAQIVREERNCRDVLWKHDRAQWIDKVFRAYGLLSYAGLMSEEEALALVSDVRLGIDMDVLDENPLIQQAIVTVLDPAYLQSKEPVQELTEEGLLQKRADAIRQVLRYYAVTVRKSI